MCTPRASGSESLETVDLDRVGIIDLDRVGIKLSPFADYLEALDSDPEALGIHKANILNNYGIMYLHAIALWISPTCEEAALPYSLLPIRKTFEGMFIAAGGYNSDIGNNAVEARSADLVAFGRLFRTNPNLLKQYELDALVNEPDKDTFYIPDPVVRCSSTRSEHKF